LSRQLVGDFLKPSIAARDQRLSLSNKLGIELTTAKSALDYNLFPSWVADELAQLRVAAQMTLGRGVQRFWVEQSNDKAKVQVAISD
jgi:hypothetical protein